MKIIWNLSRDKLTMRSKCCDVIPSQFDTDLNDSMTQNSRPILYGVLKEHVIRDFFKSRTNIHILVVYPDVVCLDRLQIRTVDLKQQFEEVYKQYFINLLSLMFDYIIEDKYSRWLVLFDE